MSCNFGSKIKLTIFGQSHSQAIGCVLDGIPAGIKLDVECIESFMARRAPGKNNISTARKEADKPTIVSGIVDGITCGTPICAIIENSDTRSGDYDKLRALPRPSHSDFAAYMKHNGFNDIRGGGNFSGRMTAPLCFAGAVCIQILESKGIHIGAHISSIANVDDEKFDAVAVSEDILNTVKSKTFPVINNEKGAEMISAIDSARSEGDSVGGTVECAVIGMPIGIGDPIFDGIESRISSIVFGIPAVKGIEFGSGFDGSRLKGSENNDEFIIVNGSVQTKTNNHGGILGGISSGMPIIFRCAFKPTPSIAKEQQTVNLSTLEAEGLVIGGRHDPCIVQRAVPCVEAAAAVAIADMIL